MSESFPIGALARLAGVKVPTVRYYEQVGLMPEAPRTEGNRRLYDDAAVQRLAFIRHARELGFEVEAVRELLALSAEPDRSCAEVDEITRRHLVEVEGRIARLMALRSELHRMLDVCGRGRVCNCRVIEVLANHDHCAGDHVR